MFQMFQIWLDRVRVKVFQWWSMMRLASYAHYQSASLRGLHTVNPLHPNTALLHWEEGTSREPLDARLSVNFPIFAQWLVCWVGPVSIIWNGEQTWYQCGHAMSGVRLPLKSNPELISVKELCVGLCPRMRALLELRPAQGNSQVKTALIWGPYPA
jgi:hypothetical protein